MGGMFCLYLLSMASACTFLRLHAVLGEGAPSIACFEAKQHSVCRVEQLAHASLLTM